MGRRWNLRRRCIRRRSSARVRPLTAILDSAPLVALGDRKDPLHERVVGVLEKEPGHLVIPAPVSAEADYLLRARAGPRAARSFLEDLAAERFRVECLTVPEYETVLGLDGRYEDLNLGLADLSVIVLARRFQTSRIVTFDERDFRAVKPIGGGFFTLLPADAGY